MLLKRSPKKFLAAQYQTRRQVLEINAIKDRNQVEQLRKLSLR
jgi:hypothetical protein